eukprot:g2610.t1
MDVVGEARVNLLGRRVWARYDDTIIAARVRDQDHLARVLWVPRRDVFLRWPEKFERGYNPRRVRQVGDLPELNLATLALHALRRDFTWLRCGHSVIARGPFSLRDIFEVDMETEAAECRGIFARNVHNEKPASPSRGRDPDPSADADVDPHPFCLAEAAWREVALRDEAAAETAEGEDDDHANASEEEEQPAGGASPACSLIVLQGGAGCGKSAWLHFLSRYLLTTHSFENEESSVPHLLELLALVQSMASQPGPAHDNESRLGVSLEFRFPAGSAGGSAPATRPVKFSARQPACGCEIALVGELCPSQFLFHRPSFGVFRLLDKTDRPPGRDRSWYGTRKKKLPPGQRKAAEVPQTGILQAASDDDGASPKSRPPDSTSEEPAELLPGMSLSLSTALSRANLDPDIFIPLLGCVEWIRGIRAKAGRGRGAVCELSEDIVTVAETLDLDVQKLGRALVYHQPANFRVTADTKFEDLPLVDPLAAEAISHNIAAFATHLHERLLALILEAVNKPATAYAAGELETLLQNYLHDKVQNFLLPHLMDRPVDEEAQRSWAEDPHTGDVLPYDNGERTLAQIFEEAGEGLLPFLEAQTNELLNSPNALKHHGRLQEHLQQHLFEQNGGASSSTSRGNPGAPPAGGGSRSFSPAARRAGTSTDTGLLVPSSVASRGEYFLLKHVGKPAHTKYREKELFQRHDNSKRLPVPLLLYLRQAGGAPGPCGKLFRSLFKHEMFDEHLKNHPKPQAVLYATRVRASVDAFFREKLMLPSATSPPQHDQSPNRKQKERRRKANKYNSGISVRVLNCVRATSVMEDLEGFQLLQQAQQQRNFFSEKVFVSSFVSKYALLGERGVVEEMNAMAPKDLCIEIASQVGMPPSDMHFSRETLSAFAANGFSQQPRFVYLKRDAKERLDDQHDALVARIGPKVAVIKGYYEGIQARAFLRAQKQRARQLHAYARAWRVRYGDKRAGTTGSGGARDLFLSSCLFLRLRIRDWWVEHCALRLQARWRGFKVRRSYKLVTFYQKKVIAATKIQCQRKKYRALIPGMRLLVLRVKTFWNRAAPYATKIQAAYRGYLTRKDLIADGFMDILTKARTKIRTHFFYSREACVIQKFYRGHLARKGYLRLRAASFVLQCLFRMLIWRRWFKNMGVSTTTLQKHWRRWWLKQTAKMVEEGSAFHYLNDADGELQSGLFGANDELKSDALNADPSSGGVLIGKLLALGLQGKSQTRVGALRGCLDRIHFSEKKLLPVGVSLGDKRSLVVCEQFEEAADQVVLQFGAGWVDWQPLKFPLASRNMLSTSVGGTIGIINKNPASRAQTTVAEMSCGTDHCVVRLASGAVFAWGANDQGQLGIPYATKASVREPIPLDLPKRCISLSAHRDGTGFVLEGGTAGVLGAGAPPQLHIAELPVVTSIQRRSKSAAAAEQAHDAQFSTLAQAATFRWFKEKSLPEMYKIFLAGNFGVLLSVFGDVFTWGSANLGQLGLGFHVREMRKPTMILKGSGFDNSEDAFPPVRHLSVSPTHCLGVSSDNEVALWGQALVAADVVRPLRRGIGFPVAVVHDLWAKGRLVAEDFYAGGGGGAARTRAGVDEEPASPFAGATAGHRRGAKDTNLNILTPIGREDPKIRAAAQMSNLSASFSSRSQVAAARAEQRSPSQKRSNAAGAASDKAEVLLGCCCGTQGGLVYSKNYVLAFRQFRLATVGVDQPDKTWLVPQVTYVTGFPQAAKRKHIKNVATANRSLYEDFVCLFVEPGGGSCNNICGFDFEVRHGDDMEEASLCFEERAPLQDRSTEQTLQHVLHQMGAATSAKHSAAEKVSTKVYLLQELSVALQNSKRRRAGASTSGPVIKSSAAWNIIARSVERCVFGKSHQRPAKGQPLPKVQTSALSHSQICLVLYCMAKTNARVKEKFFYRMFRHMQRSACAWNEYDLCWILFLLRRKRLKCVDRRKSFDFMWARVLRLVCQVYQAKMHLMAPQSMIIFLHEMAKFGFYPRQVMLPTLNRLDKLMLKRRRGARQKRQGIPPPATEARLEAARLKAQRKRLNENWKATHWVTDRHIASLAVALAKLEHHHASMLQTLAVLCIKSEAQLGDQAFALIMYSFAKLRVRHVYLMRFAVDRVQRCLPPPPASVFNDGAAVREVAAQGEDRDSGRRKSETTAVEKDLNGIDADSTTPAFRPKLSDRAVILLAYAFGRLGIRGGADVWDRMAHAVLNRLDHHSPLHLSIFVNSCARVGVLPLQKVCGGVVQLSSGPGGGPEDRAIRIAKPNDAAQQPDGDTTFIAASGAEPGRGTSIASGMAAPHSQSPKRKRRRRIPFHHTQSGALRHFVRNRILGRCHGDEGFVYNSSGGDAHHINHGMKKTLSSTSVFYEKLVEHLCKNSLLPGFTSKQLVNLVDGIALGGGAEFSSATWDHGRRVKHNFLQDAFLEYIKQTSDEKIARAKPSSQLARLLFSLTLEHGNLMRGMPRAVLVLLEKYGGSVCQLRNTGMLLEGGEEDDEAEAGLSSSSRAKAGSHGSALSEEEAALMASAKKKQRETRLRQLAGQQKARESLHTLLEAAGFQDIVPEVRKGPFVVDFEASISTGKNKLVAKSGFA